MYAKGDVTAAAYLIECKTTDAASLRITRKWLAKITREANAVQKVPALAFAIQGGRDDTATGALLEADWVCVPLSEWKRLTGGGA